MINGNPDTNNIYSRITQSVFFKRERDRGKRREREEYFTFPRAIKGPSKNMMTPNNMNRAPNVVSPT